MADFHFIQDPTALQVIATILDLAGPNFNAPYDSDTQPSDAVARNDEALTQYDVPGGTSIKGTANPAAAPSMAFVISSLLTALGPIISAYGFILPILGVIRGIIEIICCLMNPFCVIAAVIRLFTKWIPPFISLFPPAAGLIIIASTIKLILAIVFFILTEVVPTIQLIIDNVKTVIAAFTDKNETRAEAGKQKLIALLIDLLNRTGVAAVAKPLLELIFLILKLVSGFPCGGGKKSSKKVGSLGAGAPTFDGSIIDTSCCNDTQCPPVIASPPHGRGILIPKFFGDAPPLWTWQLIPITGHHEIHKIRPYLQDMRSQLNPQLDEEIDEAVPVGSNHDAAHFRLRILGRRGDKYCKDDIADPDPVGSILVPIARVSRSKRVTITNINLIQYMGVVDYCIEPNYYQLVGRNILSVGCHPDVIKAKEAVSDRFGDLEVSALEKYPELGDIPTIYDEMTDTTSSSLNRIKAIIDKPVSDYKLSDADDIQEIQDNFVDFMYGVVDQMKSKLNTMLSRMSDKISTTFEVDKNLVRAGGEDKAVVMVTPRDVTGTAIAKNIPDGVDISVEIFTDFGILQNQSRDNETGIISADLISPFPGDASVTAKVNTDFIMSFDGLEQTLKVETVKFVADAPMPKRRFVSTPSSTSRAPTSTTSEREPGSR